MNDENAAAVHETTQKYTQADERERRITKKRQREM